MASSKKRSWSLSTLPPELIEEILYRTPAESLVRSKPTCKQWYALIKNKRFIYNHLDRSRKRFIRTVDTVQIMDPMTGTRSDSPIPNTFQRPYDIDTIVHCDGLLLCMCGRRGLQEEERYVHLAIWNPVLRKIRWIKPSKCFSSSDYYGIGYDSKKCRDGYKILRFSDRRFDSLYFDYDGEVQVEIFECKKRSWKTLDAKVDWDVDIACKGVAVMGNMYWLAQKNLCNYILGFDFSVERFKDICSRPHHAYENYLACFDGDRLSLLQQDEESREIVVWVTNKLTDLNVSFTKYFNVSRPDDVPALPFCSETAHPVYFVGEHKRIIAWCEGIEGERDTFVVFTLYEIDECGVRKQTETERDSGHRYHLSFLCGYVYVPSLVPLPC